MIHLAFLNLSQALQNKFSKIFGLCQESALPTIRCGLRLYTIFHLQKSYIHPVIF